MIIAKFSKFFSRSPHPAPLHAPSLCSTTYGKTLSIVALATAAFGVSLYGASLIIGPAHAAPQEPQEQLQELKNYTPPPMFTSDEALPTLDQDDEATAESETAPATAPNLAVPSTLPATTTADTSVAPPMTSSPVTSAAPSTVTDPPRVKIISTSNKTYDAIPRATITTIPAPIANSATATPTITGATPTTTTPTTTGGKISPNPIQTTPPKSPETPAIKPSEKIYDAPPKEWINSKEDRTAGMAQHPPINQSRNDDPQINLSSSKTPIEPLIESLAPSENLPNLSPEDLLSHPAENNHVLTLRADPQDSLPTPTPLPTPVPSVLPAPTKNLSTTPAPINIPRSAATYTATNTPLSTPPTTKTPTKADLQPLAETAPPVPDHKPTTLPKTSPAKPAAVKPATSKISPPKTDSKAIDSKNTNSKTSPPQTTHEKINKDAKSVEPVKAQEPPKSADKATITTSKAPELAPVTAPATVPVITAPQPPSQAPIPTTNISPLDQFSLEFSPGSTDLTADQRELLLQNVIKTLTQDSALRVQILSYASRMDGAESSARRVSLSRALAVRSYLLENKITPSRIDVRALSDNTTETPADRMDLEFTK